CQPNWEPLLRRVVAVFGLFLSAVPCSFAANRAPVDCMHLMGWLAGGASNHILLNAIRARGIDFAVTPQLEKQLLAAGANQEVISAIHVSQPKNAKSSCPATIAQAAADAHNKQFDSAEQIVNSLLENAPGNG